MSSAEDESIVSESLENMLDDLFSSEYIICRSEFNLLLLSHDHTKPSYGIHLEGRPFASRICKYHCITIPQTDIDRMREARRLFMSENIPDILTFIDTIQGIYGSNYIN